MRSTISRSHGFLHLFGVSFALLWAGCAKQSEPIGRYENQGDRGETTPAIDEDSTGQPSATLSDSPMIKQGSLGSSEAGSPSGRSTKSDSMPRIEGIVAPVLTGIFESMQVDPTLVVWCIDQTSSATWLTTSATRSIVDFYESLDAEIATRLKTAVVSFGESAQFQLREPTSNAELVVDSIQSIKPVSNERENVYAMLNEVVATYSRYRTKQRLEVLLVLITDEAGDDTENIEQAVDQISRNILPVYVVGLPAPFGRETVYETDGNEKMLRPLPRQGPESCMLERLPLRSTADDESSSFDRLESGFGPWGLERVCRAGGGKYLFV